MLRMPPVRGVGLVPATAPAPALLAWRLAVRSDTLADGLRGMVGFAPAAVVPLAENAGN